MWILLTNSKEKLKLALLQTFPREGQQGVNMAMSNPHNPNVQGNNNNSGRQSTEEANQNSWWKKISGVFANQSTNNNNDSSIYVPMASNENPTKEFTFEEDSYFDEFLINLGHRVEFAKRNGYLEDFLLFR